MSAMAVSSGLSLRSTLNPNAPLFVPSSFKQVEDFSPKWWELVQTTAWYRDYWFSEHQQLEAFYQDEQEDIESLLPDSIDLDLAHDMSLFEAEAEAELANHNFQMRYMKPGYDNDKEAIMRSLNLQSPRYGGVKPFDEPGKYREKPVHYANPKFSARHFIQQPR